MSQPAVQYRVRIHPAQHELEVTLTAPGAGPSPLFEVPTWVPGAYGFMKYGRDLFEVQAFDGSGKRLDVRREGWSGFRVDSAGGPLELRYRTYAYDTAWGELAGFIGHDQGVLLGTRLPFLRGHEGPVTVRYELPPQWKLHHPAGARQIEQGLFEYPSYSVLLDTPVVLGAFDVITREVEGVPFHHLFLDRAVGFDSEVDGFVDALVKVAREAHALFGSFPFEHYTWIFSFSPQAHWGLEHLSSTMIGLNGNCLIDPVERMRGVRVAAHELYHAWNVCRLKPAPLGRPDHARGSFPEGLWVSEGFTRYYEFLLGVRAGEITPEAFLSNVVNYYRHLTAIPAYERVSAVDSSLTTFLNHNRYPGSVNATIDYYDKGMLVAFDMDAAMRCAETPTRLDETFRAFYEAHAGRGDGFTQQQVRDFFGERSPGLGAVFARETEQGGGLTVPQWLERLGFEVKREQVPYLGLVLKENTGPVIDNVLDISPAGATGIAPGDELLRVDGLPFNLKALQWLVSKRRTVSLEVKRGHRTFTFGITPGARSDLTALVWRGDDAQLARLRSWFKQSGFSLAPGQPVPLSAYENFHGIQTVL